MNKGLSLASHKWKIFINSDDFLYNNTNLAQSLNNVSKSSIVARAINIGNTMNWIRPRRESSSIIKYSHQAFISDQTENFNIENKISADAHMMISFQNNFEYKKDIISVFRLGGNSTGNITFQHFKEMYKIYGILGFLSILSKFIIFKIFGIYLVEKLQSYKATK